VLQDLELTAKIQKERNPAKKYNITVTKTVHVSKAKPFFDLVKKQTSDAITLSSDCQKNLPLPKLLDQMVY
jgi:hypothetical protein